jgi:tRNA(His) guanylyltransferase
MAAASSSETGSVWVERYHEGVPMRAKLAERMKEKEKEYGSMALDPDRFWLVRLDGHGFSKFTQGFTKPCDERIHEAMLRSATDLLTRFQAVSVYTESDEITLIFPSRRYYLDLALARGAAPESEEVRNLQLTVDRFTLPFNGKIQKMVSLMAGFCSTRFNYHLRELVTADASPAVRQKAAGGHAHFDARVFQLSSAREVLENIIWRSQDAVRNSKSMLGHVYLLPKVMHKLSSDQIVQRVLQDRGIDYFSFPKWFRAGVLVKRTEVVREAINRKPSLSAPTTVTCVRRILVKADWIDLVDATPELMLAKNVGDTPAFGELFSEIDYKPLAPTQ